MKSKGFVIAFLMFFAIMPSQMRGQFVPDLNDENVSLDMVLKQFSNKNPHLKSNIEEIFAYDERQIEALVMLYPKINDGRQRAMMEDALTNIARYIGKTNLKKEKDRLSYALLDGIASCDDMSKNIFMISLFKYYGTYKDIDRLNKFVDDNLYADAAIRTMAEIPSYGEHLYKLITMNDGNLDHKDSYAYAIGRLKLLNLENVLVSWLKGADDKLKLEVYASLVRMQCDSQMAKVEKGCKKLYKKKDPEIKIGAMRILVTMKGEEAMPYLYKALKNKDQGVRRTALDLMKPYANEEVCDIVVRKYAKKDAVADVVRWIGEIGNKNYGDFVMAQLSSENPDVVDEAIRTLFKLVNEEGIALVKPMFGTEHQPVITEMMITYSGNVAPILKEMMRGDEKQKMAALEILSERQCMQLHNNVVDMLSWNDKAMKDAAYKALKNVVNASHADLLKIMLANCDDEYVDDVREALAYAMKKATTEQKDTFIMTMKGIKPEAMPRFYKVFVNLNTDAGINKIVEGYHSGYDKEEAVAAILLITDKKYANVVKNIAEEDEAHRRQLTRLYEKMTR